MNKGVGIATIIGIAIVIGVIVYQINETVYTVTSPEDYIESIGSGSVAHVVYPDNPQFLGPLQINKDKYLLGENIFVVLKDIKSGDKGEVQFYTPGGVLFDTLQFDGMKKDFYKKYFKPSLLVSKDLCEKEKLIGDWTVVFKDYEEVAQLKFTVLEDILPNEEYKFEGCNVAYEVDLLDP
tara:strand:- start:645 stop:1184 length:540 start_codon:yes stop_codon:yes gene_type:complete